MLNIYYLLENNSEKVTNYHTEIDKLTTLSGLIFIVSSRVVKIMKLVKKVHELHISIMVFLLIYVMIFQNDIIRI